MFETISTFLQGLAWWEFVLPLVWAIATVASLLLFLSGEADPSWLVDREKSKPTKADLFIVGHAVVTWLLGLTTLAVVIPPTSIGACLFFRDFWIMAFAYLVLLGLVYAGYRVGPAIVGSAGNQISRGIGSFRASLEMRRQKRERSDQAIRSRAAQYAKEILEIPPETRWEIEREVVKNIVGTGIPDLLDHRGQLANDIAATERDIEHQMTGPDQPTEEVRRRMEGNLARLRERHAQVETELRQTLVFLNAIKSDFRVALHDHHARVDLGEKLDALLERIQRNGEAHAAAEREVDQVGDRTLRVVADQARAKAAADRRREPE